MFLTYTKTIIRLYKNYYKCCHVDNVVTVSRTIPAQQALAAIFAGQRLLSECLISPDEVNR